MNIFIGADHRGFYLKEKLKKWLTDEGHQVIDCGSAELQPEDDYPEMSFTVSEKLLSAESGSLAILCCGSGVGASVAANKMKGIRCGIGFSVDQVRAARHDDDMNVLSLAADYLSEKNAHELAKVFLETPFSNEARYQRRLDQIEERENVREEL